MSKKYDDLLRQLAELYNIHTSYYDVSGNLQKASRTSLCKILGALGAPVGENSDLTDHYRDRREKLWKSPCEPVSVVWDSEPSHIVLRLPANRGNETMDVRLDLENGEFREWQCNPARLETRGVREIEGIQYHIKHINIPGGLPLGYHNISISLNGSTHSVLLISAPRRAYFDQENENGGCRISRGNLGGNPVSVDGGLRDFRGGNPASSMGDFHDGVPSSVGSGLGGNPASGVDGGLRDFRNGGLRDFHGGNPARSMGDFHGGVPSSVGSGLDGNPASGGGYLGDIPSSVGGELCDFHGGAHGCDGHKSSDVTGGIGDRKGSGEQGASQSYSGKCRGTSVGSNGGDRSWGIFLPLHALHSNKSWGAGDFNDLGALLNYVYKLGGKFVGTLPLLPTFLDRPYDHSPYAPASRLFWNEFFINIEHVPEFKESPAAQKLVSSPEVRREIEDIQNDPLVDYRRGMRLKHKILSALAGYCNVNLARDAALKLWAEANPTVRDYARFRAAGEQQRAGWPVWPESMREGNISPGDYDPSNEYYHLYVQWLADKQLQSLAGHFKGPGRGIYMDLPLGVHHDSYDVWRKRNLFVLNTSCGAPPDPFSNGQDWGFPPLNPDRIRREKYGHFIDIIRHHLKYAGLLRIDHIMGLHRLFWIPRGLPASEGVYVKYRADEFYAILTLESHRNQTPLIGEDLGTVPECLRPAMEKHNLHKMYVLPFEQKNPIPEHALACLNTHDMLPFASYWLQEDLEKRFDFSTHLHQEGWMENNTINVRDVLISSLKLLAASEARFLLINLEDLWQETAPQNIPGINNYPNWQRKSRYKIEELANNTTAREILEEVNLLRSRKKTKR